jgi:prevent-host-death family protein
MPMVNIYEAKTKLSKLVDVAASGTDVVIARNGTPVARLTRIESGKHDYRLGLLNKKGGWIAPDFDAPLTDDILAQFEGR